MRTPITDDVKKRADELIRLQQDQEFLSNAEKELEKSVSPPGSFPHMSPLLEARRLKFGIPDGAFEAHPLYDRLYIWQVPKNTGDTFEGTSIIMPDVAKERTWQEANRGIIVGAGIEALDNIRSNGSNIGHMVRFIRLAPYRDEIGCPGGVPLHNIVCRDGDLVSDEDLEAGFRAGEVKTVWDEESEQHLFVDREGVRFTPKKPFVPGDY